MAEFLLGLLFTSAVIAVEILVGTRMRRRRAATHLQLTLTPVE